VNTWTVNARHDLERMVAIGIDVVITDTVALAARGGRSDSAGSKWRVGPSSA